MSTRLTVNALLNLLAGASSALYAVAVPALLASRISAVDLSIWCVILQVAVFVAPLSLGIQSVLMRRVALHSGSTGKDTLGCTMVSAVGMLGLMSCAFIALGILAAMSLGSLYPEIPTERINDARLALLLMLPGQASMIPASALTGYFFGLQRNFPVTVNVLGSKVVASVAIVGLSESCNLVELAAISSMVLLAGNAWLYRAYRKSSGVPIKWNIITSPETRRTAQVILRDCAPICLWTATSFIVYGGSSMIASAVDFDNYPSYTLASGAVMTIMGFHSAALNPLISHIAVVNERGGAQAVARIMKRASLVSAIISSLVMLCYSIAGPDLIRLLLPARTADVAQQLVFILLFGNVIRLVGLPYANLLIGLGRQNKIIWTPVFEAIITLAATLLLAQNFGLKGVAAGIVVGSAASIGLHLLVNIPSTHASLPIQRRELFTQVGLILLPGVVAMLASGYSNLPESAN